MALRWTAAAALEREKRFRRVNGYRDLWLLARALVSSLGRNEVIGGVIRANDHAFPVNPFVGQPVAEFMSWARQLR